MKTLFAFILSASIGLAQLTDNGPRTMLNGTTVNSNGFTNGIVIPAALMNGLIARYSANEGSGTTLTDRTTNGNNGTLAGAPNTPTWPAGGGLQFSAAINQWVALPAAVNTAGRTYMAAVCQPTMAQVNTGTGMDWTFPSLLTSTSSSGLVMSFMAGSPGYNLQTLLPTMGIAASGNPNHATQSKDYAGGCAVITWVIGTSGDSTTDHLAINGVEVSGYTVGPGTSGAGMGQGTLQIGGTGWTSGIGFAGTLQGLWVWNRPLSMTVTVPGQSSEVQSAYRIVRGDAESRGVVFTPQFGFFNGDALVCIGDSLTYGTNGSNPPTTSPCSTTNLTSLTGSPTLKNFGNPGGVMMGFAGKGLYEAGPYLTKNGRATAIIWGCTNDGAFGYDHTAASCWKYMQGLSQNLRGQGIRTVLVTMISATGRDTFKNAIDPLINAGWSQVADGEVNPAANALLGADGAFSGACFNADHIHLTDACYAVVAGYYQNSYNYIWGATQQNPTAISGTYVLTAADAWATFTANTVTATLPTCIGYGAGYTWHLKAATSDVLKTSTAAQTIDGVDYSASGLALATGSQTAFSVVPGPVASGGCTWTQIQ